MGDPVSARRRPEASNGATARAHNVAGWKSPSGTKSLVL